MSGLQVYIYSRTWFPHVGYMQVASISTCQDTVQVAGLHLHGNAFGSEIMSSVAAAIVAGWGAFGVAMDGFSRLITSLLIFSKILPSIPCCF